MRMSTVACDCAASGTAAQSRGLWGAVPPGPLALGRGLCKTDGDPAPSSQPVCQGLAGRGGWGWAPFLDASPGPLPDPSPHWAFVQRGSVSLPGPVRSARPLRARPEGHTQEPVTVSHPVQRPSPGFPGRECTALGSPTSAAGPSFPLLPSGCLFLRPLSSSLPSRPVCPLPGRSWCHLSPERCLPGCVTLEVATEQTRPSPDLRPPEANLKLTEE